MSPLEAIRRRRGGWRLGFRHLAIRFRSGGWQFGVSRLWRFASLAYATLAVRFFGVRDFGVLPHWRFATSAILVTRVFGGPGVSLLWRFVPLAFRDLCDREEGACGEDVPKLLFVVTPTAVVAFAVDGRRERCSGP